MTGSTRVGAVTALAGVCCLMIVGCSGAGRCTTPKGAALESRDAVFYRHSNEQAVFRVSDTTYCMVTDPGQMAAFGGFAQVRVVPPSVDFKRGKAPLQGMNCPTPAR